MGRKIAVKIEGKDQVVELDVDDGVTRARIAGTDEPGEVFEVVEAEPGQYLLRRGDTQAVARVDGTNGKLTVAVRRAGSDVVVVAAEVADARRAAIAAPARVAGDSTAPVTIKSPIPGRIVKVLVKAGDRIAAGQTAVVLEAMKMENELRAPRAGQVTAVRCTEGTAVEAGQDLVSLL